MALIRYGGGVLEMRGSIGGNTFARNHFGAYNRARTKPINPRSSRQMGARVAIMFLAEQWRESPMDDAKRLAWEVYANSVNWQNKLGDIVKLTGFNMFIRTNAAILRLGGTIVTDGPEDLGLPAGDPLMQFSDARANTQQVSLTFDDTMDWCDEDNAYMAFDVGEPQNPTHNFFDGPWRYFVKLPGSSVDPPSSPSLNWNGLPWTLVTGQKLWFRAHIIRADGRVSTKFVCDPLIVVAGV